MEHDDAAGRQSVDGTLQATSGRDTGPARHLGYIPAEDDEAASSVELVEVFPQAVLAVDDDGFITDGDDWDLDLGTAVWAGDGAHMMSLSWLDGDDGIGA